MYQAQSLLNDSSPYLLLNNPKAMVKNLLLISLFAGCGVFCHAQQPGDARDTSIQQEVTEPAVGGIFTNFSGVVKDYNKVLLQWDVDSSEEGDYFVVERGIDGEHYETIGAVRKAANTTHYELMDAGPPNGTDFYRIRYTGKGGKAIYSKPVQFSLSGDVDFKFYPNPVDKLFIIRTEHAVEIQVIDGNGAIRINRRLQPGIQVVNASALERGIYVLRVADKESNRTISNQLLKN